MTAQTTGQPSPRKTAATPPLVHRKSPVADFEDIGKGSGHRRWANAARQAAQRDAAAYHEAGNALRASIKATSRWPFAMDKAAALLMIRMHHAFLSRLREAEAQALMKYRRKYIEMFATTPPKAAAFDPHR